MKRTTALFLALVIALVFAFPAFSAISTPIVRVNLIRTTVITQQQLDEKLAQYKQAYGDSIDSNTVLEAMISDELLEQALERDGYVLTEDAKNELLAAQKSAIEQQVGVQLSDADFASLIQANYGASVEEYKDYIADQYTVQNYVLNKKSDMFKEENLMPTNAEVEDYYKRNKSTFISPENVKLSHIYFEFGDDKNAAYRKALDVSNQIKSGRLTFEKAVTQYSEDKNSINKAGDIGWLAINDTENIQVMGQNFFDKVFALDAGEVSGVIESNAGYHIVKVSVHNEAKFLGIDDKTSPTADGTVRDYITNGLYESKMNAMFQQAYMSLITDLKNTASIRYLTK